VEDGRPLGSPAPPASPFAGLLSAAMFIFNCLVVVVKGKGVKNCPENEIAI
jgi:hypothetical protein